MAIADDISIASNGDIRYTGTGHGVAGAGYYTVIELHRFLQDLADDAVASGDDLIDITFDTPSDRSTDNIITILSPYNIDQTLSEHLYNGSIIQNGGDDIWDGFINYGNEGIDIQLIQNGSIVSNDFWNNTPNGETLSGLNRSLIQGISHRFMVKVRTGGADIDGRRFVGISREPNKSNAEFPVAGTNRGNNTLALSNDDDLNNQTPNATVATWNTITNTEGYRGLDVDNNGVDENYYSEWDRDVYSINQLYERTKWLTQCASGTTATTANATLYGIAGNIFRGVTHEIDIDTPTGTFNAVEPVSWSGGTGQMLAIDSPTAGTKMWIQLLTGVAPTDNEVITGGTSSATCAVNITVTTKTTSSEFIGQSTGSSIIGAFGIGIEPTDLTANDKVTDLTGATITPPNYVNFSVTGTVAGEDRILVAPESGGMIEYSQLTLASGVTVGSSTTAVVNEAIPTDTPASGTIRIFNGNTFFRQPYTSWSGSTFTLDGTALDTASASANTFISYIDSLSDGTNNTTRFTAVYTSDRPLYVRVRDGGASPIKTYESTATLGSAGGSSSVIRTGDE